MPYMEHLGFVSFIQVLVEKIWLKSHFLSKSALIFFICQRWRCRIQEDFWWQKKARRLTPGAPGAPGAPRYVLQLPKGETPGAPLDGLSMVMFRDIGYDIPIYGGFLKWGYPKMDGL